MRESSKAAATNVVRAGVIPQFLLRPEKTATSETAMGSMAEIKVPDIGDFKDVEVIEVLVKPGDALAQEQSLITAESDKASMEIPSPAAGVVQSLRVKIGDKVSQGTPIAVLATSAGGPAAVAPAVATSAALAPAPSTSPASTAFATEMAERPPAPASDAGSAPHASPSVRKFARELGVELAHVAGSGPNGRITQDDVRAHVKSALATAPRPGAGGAPALAAGGG